MKRKLESKYKKLVKYINKRRPSTYLAEIITDFEYADGDLTSKEMEVLNSVGLNADTHSSDFDKLIQIIVNIYNNNYELEEQKYRFYLKGAQNDDFYKLYFSLKRVSGCDVSIISERPTTLTEEQFLKYLPDEMDPDQFEREEVTE
ncbi:hypothetical protein [Companilactobacillus sp. HBUAS56257]|jgi:hypothetical protein|uniref:Uncharacterized protein n=1 Tax=Candidatus Companilactobacillus pullicola TaxID=2838523 RepID=A0A9D2CNF1_9LACO|nr:hypothetical protein [Candidatus Companilactobacillus pullicola]